jgi:hypothetical protein
MQVKKIDQIICVCCARDAIVWKIASTYIAKNIDSVHYKVIVPDNEVELFKKISSKPFEVLRESIYTERFSSEIKKRLSKKLQDSSVGICSNVNCDRQLKNETLAI